MLPTDIIDTDMIWRMVSIRGGEKASICTRNLQSGFKVKTLENIELTREILNEPEL